MSESVKPKVYPQHAPSRFSPPRHLASGAAEPPRVAVLYQAVDPPIINGVQKPPKPGGYRDSGADVAYALQQGGTQIVTPDQHPAPEAQDGWCFPDSEHGILSALGKGATYLWANTILFDTHPLQQSTALDSIADHLHIVGQPPRLVDQYDDKNYVNSLLRRTGGFGLPQSWIVEAADAHTLGDLPYPVVAKPIRGRGSHGVKLCHEFRELQAHLQYLLSESPQVMIEEYLAGQEATVTVMPPSRWNPCYWALPVVSRFNHSEGVAPYSGAVSVTKNSRAITKEEFESDKSYDAICRQCVRAAELLRVTAPIRIDVRRFSQDSEFALFDVNMKPNMTGPGRPGRSDQASLTALAAAQLGWSYADLLHRILDSARTLRYLRGVDTPEWR